MTLLSFLLYLSLASVHAHDICLSPAVAQLGGLNTLLQMEVSRSIPIVSETPTIILGMDVSHGQPGQSDRPSIAAVRGMRFYSLNSS
jgi:hypothetical protein